MKQRRGDGWGGVTGAAKAGTQPAPEGGFGEGNWSWPWRDGRKMGELDPGPARSSQEANTVAARCLRRKRGDRGRRTRPWAGPSNQAEDFDFILAK